MQEQLEIGNYAILEYFQDRFDDDTEITAFYEPEMRDAGTNDPDCGEVEVYALDRIEFVTASGRTFKYDREAMIKLSSLSAVEAMDKEDA